MADVQQTLALLVLAQEYKDDLVSQVNRAATLCKLLPVEACNSRNIGWVAGSDGALTELYAEGADAVNFGSDAQSSAILSVGLYRNSFHVTDLAKNAAALAGSPDANANLWLSNMKNGVAALSSKLNTELYTGVSAGGIVGLESAIGDDTNTYATIIRSSNAFWKPNLSGVASGSVAVTKDDIRADLRVILKRGGERPDLAMVGPETYAVLGKLFDSQIRVNVGSDGMSAPSVNGGIDGIRFNGCQFVEDKDCPEGKIFYLNTRHVSLRPMPMVFDGFSPEQKAAVMGDDGFGPLPLMFDMYALAKTGAAQKASIVSTIQLQVKRPNSMGVRSGISYDPADYI